MIYLSWSLIHLCVVVSLWAMICSTLIWNLPQIRNHLYAASILSLIVICLMAFDVGTRQEYLQRSKFNATVPTESVEKKESDRMTKEDVKITFEQAVKETK